MRATTPAHWMRGFGLILVWLVTLALPLDAVKSAPLAQSATPGAWDAGFAQPGLNGGVNAIAADPSGQIYVGGSFSLADGQVVNNLARWDGTRWHPLGSGVNSPVNALVVAADGALYAAGNFTSASGVSVRRVARWDGAAWAAVGDLTGVDGTINALVVGPDGTLYAGGGFAGSPGSGFVSRWDGSAWQILGPTMNNAVQSLGFSPAGTLLAAGSFSGIGATEAARIAQWDGVQWQPFTTGLSGTVFAMVIAPDGTLYAGGNLGLGLAVPGALHIARWNGRSWEALASGTSGTVRSLALAPDGALYAGGAFTSASGTPVNRVARWDGANWQALEAGFGEGLVLALTLTADGTLYSGGSFATAGTRGVNQIARWDGSLWNALSLNPGLGANGTVLASATAPDGSLYIGGTFTTAGQVAANRVARWDGSAWQALGSGMNGSVNALVAGPDGTLYAGGNFSNAGGVTANRVARWDGSTWQALGAGMNNLVSALALAPDGTLFAGGQFVTADGESVNSIARWDGTRWQAVGGGTNGSVRSLRVAPDGSLYAAGSFTTAGGVPANAIARWDGSAWQALGSGLNQLVQALSFAPDGTLVAGGNFTTAGDNPANYIAQWDGTTWTSLGAGVNNSVLALAHMPDGTLYVGGDFTGAEALTAGFIASWDGTSWRTVGAGTNSRVSSLVASADGALFVGGFFSQAGGRAAAQISRWWQPFDVTIEQAPTQADPTNQLPIQFVASFSRPINPASFTSSDLVFGGSAPGTPSAMLSPLEPFDATAFLIAVDGLSGNGTLTVSLPAGQVSDRNAVPNRASTSNDAEVLFAAIGPTVSFAPISPDPRTTPVSSLGFSFSTPVTGVSLAALSLSRDGVPLDLSATILRGSGAEYQLEQLDALTAAIGTYTLNLVDPDASIRDALGNPLSSSGSVSWRNELVSVTPDALPIFADRLERGWIEYWSWGATTNPAATSPVYEGEFAYRVDFTNPWGGFRLYNPGGDSWANVGELHFALHGNASPSQRVRVWAITNAGETILLGDVTATPDSWTRISLRLPYATSQQPIRELIWQEFNGVAGGSILLDLIELDGTPAPAPPPLSPGVIFEDSLRRGWAERWSWGVSLDPAVRTPTFSGEVAYKVQYASAWGGFRLLHPSGDRWDGANELQFALHGGTTGGQRVRVWVRTGTGTLVNLGEATATADTWTDVRLSLPASLSEQTINELIWQEALGRAGEPFYLDFIALSE